MGGVIELIATSGLGVSNLTSKVTVNGGGINIYSGVASPIGSVFGYTFLNATLGISLVVGDYSSPFQVPGTVYLYGDQGVVVGSPLYAYNILGYWSGVAPPSNLTITGRQTILGNSFVNISNVDHIYFDAGGAGALSGVQSINGNAYPPTPPVPTPDPILSSIRMNPAGFISTVRIEGVSTINNTPYPPPLPALEANLQVSTILVNAVGFISTLSLEGLSTINGTPFPNPDPEVSTLIVNATGYISTLALEGLSTINGAAYPTVIPEAPDIQVSTILVNPAGFISTLFLEGVSTINGAAYPTVIPEAPDIQVSTILVNPAGFISTLFLEGISTINSIPFPNPNPQVSTLVIGGPGSLSTSFIYGLVNINGAPYPPPGLREIQVSTITLAPNGFVSTLQLEGVSTINGAPFPNLVKQATYYKSVAQNLTSGNTDITFDLSGAWNNADGYITHTDGTSDFTVSEPGLYQLDFNTTVSANGATWTTTTNKSANIDITRTVGGTQAIIVSSAFMAPGTNYGHSLSSSYYLETGDVITLRLSNNFTSGPPTAQGLTNTFDLGTYFSWRFIS